MIGDICELFIVDDIFKFFHSVSQNKKKLIVDDLRTTVEGGGPYIESKSPTLKTVKIGDDIGVVYLIMNCIYKQLTQLLRKWRHLKDTIHLKEG